jgi:hypothetical protein
MQDFHILMVVLVGVVVRCHFPFPSEPFVGRIIIATQVEIPRLSAGKPGFYSLASVE